MSQPLKVEATLSRAELDELETFARERRRTIDELHQWLLERQFNVSRKAAASWRQKFDEEEAAARFSRSGELARAIKSAVKADDFEAVADAAVMQLTQVVFEQAARLESDGDLDPLDVQRMTRSVVNLVGSKAGLTKILADKFDREISQRQEKRPDRTITAADIAEARKAIFGS